MNTPHIAKTILTEVLGQLLSNPNQGWYHLILQTDAPALGKAMAVMLCAETNKPGMDSLQIVETTLDALSRTITLAKTVIEEQDKIIRIPVIGGTR